MCPQTKSQSGTTYSRAGLVSLRDFYMVSGWLKNSLRQRRKDDSKFEWNDEDQGTIMGNIIEMREILNDKISPFGIKGLGFRIETERNKLLRKRRDLQARILSDRFTSLRPTKNRPPPICLY